MSFEKMDEDDEVMGSMDGVVASLARNVVQYDEMEEANEMRRLTQKVEDSLHFLELIHRTPIEAYKKEAELHKGKLGKARNRALVEGETICELRERAYFLARERQARLLQQDRLKKQLAHSIQTVSQEQELQDIMLAKLDVETRELEAHPQYAAHVQNLKAAQLEVKKLQAANRYAGNVRSTGASGGRKKKKSTRNLKLMRAVVLSVEFDGDLRKFRIPWSYTFGELLVDCVQLWGQDLECMVLEDGFDNVWLSDSCVTSEVQPQSGAFDPLDETPRIVMVDKTVKLAAFDTETDEQRAAKVAAKMVSAVPVGPQLEERNAESFRVRAGVASRLGGFFLFCGVFIACVMMKWDIFNAWVMQDSIVSYFAGESFPEEAKPNVAFSMMDVANSEEMYQWIRHIFIPGMFAAENQMVLLYNRPIGGVQIRSLRVTSDSCTIPSDYSNGLGDPGCYGPYNSGNVDKDPYGPVSFQPNQYRWYYKDNVEEAIPYTSPHTSIVYDKSGYYMDLPLDEEIMTKAVDELEANEYTGPHTRAVIVTWVLFNVNFNIFNYARVLFEFTPGGLVLPSIQTKSFRMDTYGESKWQIRFCFDMLFVYCTLLWIKKIKFNIQDAYLDTASYLSFFTSFWNWMDVAITVLCLVYIGMEFALAVDPSRSDFNIATTTYKELGRFAEAFELSIQLNAFAALLVVLRFFEFLNISERIALLSRTISIAIPDVISFFFMFGIVFFAFVMMAHTLFGCADESYSQLVKCVTTLLVMLLGEFDYEALQQASQTFAPIFFILYNVLIVFVLLNVFIGIIGEAYGAAKQPFSGGLGDDCLILLKGLAVSVVSIFKDNAQPTTTQVSEEAAEDPGPAPVSYTHLTLPTKRIV
eukprot:TRINITY_DN4613_c0_g1_i13.p1 TRINITY_DN4613_c0_g1~~TRINITY_DN4613_c0_g1_i13.p1  ORF type:complete len:868 (-),score=250.20 TRINITY_DN4613_c0_g1_i13:104-2707(-)